MYTNRLKKLTQYLQVYSSSNTTGTPQVVIKLTTQTRTYSSFHYTPTYL